MTKKSHNAELKLWSDMTWKEATRYSKSGSVLLVVGLGSWPNAVRKHERQVFSTTIQYKAVKLHFYVPNQFLSYYSSLSLSHNVRK
jgi:hypothetical protein